MKPISTRHVLDSVARDYVPEDVNLLPQIVARIEKEHRKTMKPKTKFVIAAVLILLTFIVIAASIPGAATAMKRLFGYIPGVGIVDQSAPIRVLAAPVIATREGISITVTSATLTADKTHIEYRIFGVPGTAYPDREDVIGCIKPEYLRLPDGTKLERTQDLPPVPSNVNEAVFVIPCIDNTLPGKVPENWELSLRFVPAPPDLTVMPILELSPSPKITATDSPTAPQVDATLLSTAAPTEVTSTLSIPQNTSVAIDRVIETGDGYILVGKFQPKVQAGQWSQVTRPPQIIDATGKEVPYTVPQDIEAGIVDSTSGGFGLVFQFKAASLSYPLTITLSGVNISQADPNARAEFEFDAGSNPQPGQEWTLNREIQLAGHTIKLVSITADNRVGYSFKFESDPKVNDATVDISGYTPNGGGGGGGAGMTNGTFTVSLSYAELPKGMLKIAISNLTVVSDTITWQGQWSPTTPRTDWPATSTPQPGVCLTADSLDQLKPAPASLTGGTALVYEQLDGADKWGLVLYNLDGSQKQTLVPDSSWGALSPDGSQAAYPAPDGIHVMDLASRDEKVLAGATGFDLHWSTDSSQIAYVGGGTDNVFIANIDGSPARRVSDQSYEALIGWSLDSAQLYFVAPFTGGVAWKVYALDLTSGAARDLFTIENGSYKAINAALSPDGAWIAYRGRDNSSLYLVRTDGSDMHLVMDKPSAAISGVVWSKSGWLGVSLMNAEISDSTVVLVKPENCQTYLLPALHGELEGLTLP
jgi:hypothetical protein